MHDICFFFECKKFFQISGDDENFEPKRSKSGQNSGLTFMSLDTCFPLAYAIIHFHNFSSKSPAVKIYMSYRQSLIINSVS